MLKHLSQQPVLVQLISLQSYIVELRHERPDADPGGVGLDDAEDVADEAGRHPQPRAHAPDAAVARSHERVRAC